MEIESNISPSLVSNKFADLSIHPRLDVPSFSLKPWVLDNEIAGKGFEDINIAYANLALQKYNAYTRKNFVLVKIGYVAVGSIPNGHVVHMNFETIRTDVPDAQLLTVFAEFDVIENVANLGFMRLLGSTDKLPDKAEIRGCLYCLGKRIHHPVEDGYRTGREDLYPILLEKIQMVKNDENGMKEQYKGLELDDRCARLALEKYNKEEGENFEFVDTYGIGGTAFISPGLIIHLNFEAKKNDDPEITFFAEAIRFDNDCILVTFCKSLGPADSLPEEVDSCVCDYCYDDGTYHPVGGGYLTGRGKWKFNIKWN